MRHSWRLLLFRKCAHSSLRTPFYSSHPHLQVHSSSPIRSLYSFHSLSHHASLVDPKTSINCKNPIAYNFSSEPLVEPSKETDHCLLVSDIFTKFSDFDEISKELELNSIATNHEIVLKVLKSLYSNPDVAKRFFNWVLERDSDRLSSKAYNLMLGCLGVNGSVEEFWGLVESMKKKGYGVSKGTRDKVTEKFEKEGLENDLEKLKGVFATGSVDKSMEKNGLRVSRIIRNQVWGDDVEQQIKDLNIAFSSDLVKIVLDNLAIEPTKAFIFFRWVEESKLFKHDGRSYNVMARVLGRENCIDRFWKLVDEMRSNGYEMEMETFDKVLGRFLNRRMLKESVDLYEFAMGGANKPSVECCTFLLKKLATGKEWHVNLFSRVVKIFLGSDNELTDSMLDAVLKSLSSVGRMRECNKVLKEMKEGGFIVNANLQNKIAVRLGKYCTKYEVSEFINHMEASGGDLDAKGWASLVEGNCVSGHLKRASVCFQNMIEKKGVSNAGYAFDCLVHAYCLKNKAIEASHLMHHYVSRNQLKPWHTTYKLLISKLLVRKLFVQGGFSGALRLLDLMKKDGFPPFIDPFIHRVSQSGSSDNAIAFMNAMTSKEFPSTPVVLRLFEAFFKAGRRSQAHDLLSKCPSYIRNHADVLNLFYSMESAKATAPAAAATNDVAVEVELCRDV